MRKLSVDDLQIESFETLAEAGGRGTVKAHETEGFDCETIACGTNEFPCTWMPNLQCASNEIAYPSECTGCEQGVCHPSQDHCPGASYPVWNC